MPSVIEAEIIPNLVVHQDTAVLRLLGGCSTNAELTKSEDRAVVDPHYFLVLETDQATGSCVAVPLFSEWAPGSVRLFEDQNSGLASLWKGQDSFFSKWQHWKIPLSSVVAASSAEQSSSADRRRYAANAPHLITRIAEWQHQNRAPWREL